jgi:hypothetical protein
MTSRSLTSTGCTTGTDHQLSPSDGAGSVARDLGPRTQVMPKRARRPHPQRRAIRSVRRYSLSCSEDMRLRIRRPGVRIPPSAQPREPRSTATTAVLAGLCCSGKSHGLGGRCGSIQRSGTRLTHGLPPRQQAVAAIGPAVSVAEWYEPAGSAASCARYRQSSRPPQIATRSRPDRRGVRHAAAFFTSVLLAASPSRSSRVSRPQPGGPDGQHDALVER